MKSRALNVEQRQEESAAKSAEIMSAQIDGITKLAGVIDLVDKTFTMQHAREDDVTNLVQSLKETNKTLSSFRAHYESQFRYVLDLILPFQKHSRMNWTHLTSQEEALVTKALTTFHTIPPFVIQGSLDENEGKNRYQLAQMYYLLGVGAFYTEDIDGAAKYLEGGLRIYGEKDAPPEYLFPQAFCSHFLGLVEKNWRALSRPLEANLLSAKNHLKAAARRLETRTTEFLTPVTLAEVLSYSEQTQEEALGALDNIIVRLGRLKDAGALDPNQRSLLGRAFLIRGNVDFVRRNKEAAHGYYKQSFDSTGNVFARLSMAQTLESDPLKRREMFKHGLTMLEGTASPLARRETSGRLTALAWAIIATREVANEEQQNKYTALFEGAGANVRSVGGREPLFFCPMTKTLVNFDGLRANSQNKAAS